MRKISDHRLDDGSFNDAVSGLVRSSPWWTISLVAHAIAFAVLWSIRTGEAIQDQTPPMQASVPDTPPDVDVPPEIDPPELPEETIVEKPIEITDEVDTPEEDTDNPDTHDVSGEAGDKTGPLESSYWNTAIGIGNGATGGQGPGGSGRHGGFKASSKPTKITLLSALEWLAKHQDVDDDGKWDADDFMKHDPADDRCDGPGGALYDPGVTGLALLAFLGAGFTDRGTNATNPFARNVRGGLRYLMTVQDEEGVFGSRASHAFMYNHAIATLAMCEAYWMTRNPRYRKPAQDGLSFIAAARNPYLAWRYEPRGGDNDTSVTAWCVMALKSGKFADLDVDPDALRGARLWVDKVTDVSFGQVGYTAMGGPPARPEGKQDRFPADKSQAMTAAGMLSRVFLGEDPRTSDMIRKGARLCLEKPPVWRPDDGSIDMYYWYYGTLAMFQVGGPAWRDWNVALEKAVIATQHGKGSGRREGSWDPIGAWGDDGGRVYATAVMAMCLEVHYRYDKVFGGIR
jgi:hypothetical protein